MEKEKVFAMKLAKIYPLLVQKAERKGRTKAEVNQVICWLTGYDEDGLVRQLQEDVDYRTFSYRRLASILMPDRLGEVFAVSALKP